MQSQPISPKSAPKSKASSGSVAPRALTQARTAVRKVAARKTPKRKAPPFFQASTEGNSSEGAQSSPRDSSSDDTERSTTKSQTDSPTSASKKRSTPEPAVLQAPIQAGSRLKRRCVTRARTGPQVTSPSQEVSNVISSTAHASHCLDTNWTASMLPLQTNGTSSGDVEEVPMPSATLGLPNSPSMTDQVATLAETTAKPIVATSASIPFLREVSFIIPDPLSSSVVCSCCSCPPVRGVILQACCHSIPTPSSQLLPKQVKNRILARSTAHSSASKICSPPRSIRWLRALRQSKASSKTSSSVSP